MQVQYFTEDALATLKKYVPEHLLHYAEPTNQWIYDYFDGPSPFATYAREFPDFTLSFDHGLDPSEQDVGNSIAIYSAMKSLTDSQAADEQLWAGMCHGNFWGFLQQRWQKDLSKLHEISEEARKAKLTVKKTKQETKETQRIIKSLGRVEGNIKSRYFFGQNHKRSLFTNTLARYWWVARLTYDPKRSDPFELTKYFNTRFIGKSLLIFSRNYMSGNNVAFGLISALKDFEKDFVARRGEVSNELCEELYTEASRFLNNLGGLYILDFFTEEEIAKRVSDHLREKFPI